MDLPTYTNIWRIEKRLYKLYDLRLPMPLPIVWIGVFVGVSVPWSLLLVLVGVPVEMPWHVLFLVPPGIVTWLSTRPVIEGKRLNELLESHLRYLGQPKAWYRLAPTSEPETVSFSGRVWRSIPARGKAPKAPRKARQPQRRREGQRITGPRQVRPAVAAAAAAAGQAPVAEPTTARTGWGTRRGTAPSLRGQVRQAAPETVQGPILREEGLSGGSGRRQELPLVVVHGDEPVAAGSAGSAGSMGTAGSAGSRGTAGSAGPAASAPASAGRDDIGRAPAAPEPGARMRAVREPAESSDREAAALEQGREQGREQGVQDFEGGAPGEAEARAGQGAVVPIRGTEGHKHAAGKPIDTEALRRLRKLAASADAPGDPANRPEGEPREGERREEDVARDQHRKGQPPRLGPALVLPGTQRVWPPLNPDAKPLPRPGIPRGDRAEGRDEAASAARGATAADSGDPGTRRPPKRGDVPADAASHESDTVEETPDRQDTPEGTDPQRAGTAGTVPVPRPGEGRVRRVESVVGRDSGGWRRIAQVVVGGGGVRTDGSEIDEARARGVFSGSRRVVVLGCTGGAGQSTTALMLGHTFAGYRDDRVVAVDANSGRSTLSTKIQPETPETLTSLLSGLDRVSGYLTMRGYTTRTSSGLEVISADTDADAEQRLTDRSLFSDHRLGESMRLLDRHYKLAVIDPAAALAARVLPYADQLILVVPASEEASEAVAMTYEWLDGHGCAELRRRAVMVVNGVSRRSMADVEQAESVASGRCRAIVRVPWEDDLAPGGAEVVDPGQLRAAGRRAYLALAGVVVAGFAAQTVRPSEEELASDPPGTRIGER